MNLLPHLPEALQPAPIFERDQPLTGTVEVEPRFKKLWRPPPKVAVAPSLVGLLPKSTYDPITEARCIMRACESHQDSPFAMPVLYGRDTVLGWTYGPRGTGKVHFVPDGRSLDAILPYRASITSYSDIISACAAGRKANLIWSKAPTTAPVANNYYDMFPVTGNPTSGTYSGAAFTAKAFSSADTGSLPIGSNVSPQVRVLLSLWGVATAGATQPVFILVDRVVAYEQNTWNNAASQAMTNGSTPPGTRYTTTGSQLIITCQTVESAIQQSFTVLTYANQAQTTGQLVPCATTLTNIIASVAAPTANLGARVVSPCLTAAGTSTAGYTMPLAAGDSGVNWVQNYTTSANATPNTGKMAFVLAFPLFTLPLAVLNNVALQDAVNMVANVGQVFDAACLQFIVYFPVATGATLTGEVDDCWN